MRYSEEEVVARIDRLTVQELRLWVQTGLVRPSAHAAGPVFDDLDVARLRLVCDLSKEMALHAETLPVVLSLIDQVHGLRGALRSLSEAVQRQPEEVRRAIVADFRSDRGRPD